MKTAVITGVTGQDGMYLSSFLLSKGYKVIGIVRRSSVNNLERLMYIKNHPNLVLISGDVTDLSSLERVAKTYKPDEWYNLAAQSHVGESFNTPISTLKITGTGALNCLEAIRQHSPGTKYYFAGSSEQFGNYLQKNKDNSGFVPLDELSPMEPASPYACAKVIGFNITRNYRESYGMFACTGILFNHESNCISTTIITRINRRIDIKRIVDLLPKLCRETFIPQQKIEIWDGNSWQDIKAITVRPVEKNNKDQEINVINTRHGIVKPTKHHNMLNQFNEKRRADSFEIDNELLHGEYPEIEGDDINISIEEAWFLGRIARDGWVDSKCNKFSISCLDENDKNDLLNVWSIISNNKPYVEKVKRSEYGHTRYVVFSDAKWYDKFQLRISFYNSDKQKKVPTFILNANKDIQLAFLRGYNIPDGLKANKCTYEFKKFKTESAHLAHGLLFLVANTTKQNWNITYEYSNNNNKYYYSINLLSNRKSEAEKELKVCELLNESTPIRKIASYSRSFIQKTNHGGTACLEHHLAKPEHAIKKIVEEKTNWVADIQTTSGRFMAGVGTIIVANSPVRGDMFVTRKITKALAQIKHGIIDRISFGNLNTQRDWGFAGDYIKAMWLMLQQDSPDDYVIGTGKSYSCQDFLDLAAEFAGISNVNNYIDVDKNLYRPTDVHILVASAKKAEKKLNWKPETNFKQLVQMMVDHDMYYYNPMYTINQRNLICRQYIKDSLCIKEN